MRGQHEYNNFIIDIFLGCVFELPMTRKQKTELELIMLTRKFNGEDNLNLKLMQGFLNHYKNLAISLVRKKRLK